MSEISLDVEKREEKGKNKAKALRKKGIIPATFYAQNKKPISLSVTEKDIKDVLSKDYSVISLKVDKGRNLKSIIREIQYHPVNRSILHVDFLGVKLTEKITSEVPLVLEGIPVGVKENGGVLEQIIRDIEIEALPLEIPPHITLDVSHLDIGDSIHVSDIKVDKIKILTKGEYSVATVILPRKEAEEVEKVEEVLEEEMEETEETEAEEKSEGEEEQ